MEGRRFGRWTVLRESRLRAPSGLVKWLCVCDCGTVGTVVGSALRAGRSLSCGCLAVEQLIERSTVEVPNYRTAHSRIRARKGSASRQTCRCGSKARYWAYDHSDPDELRQVITDGRNGIVREVGYSMKPEHYVALCNSCHTSLDRLYAHGKTEAWAEVCK